VQRPVLDDEAQVERQALRLVVVLGHTACGAVKGAIETAVAAE